MTFDLPALAAILAVVGYSLNDTVVVFDRIRERFLMMRKGTSERGDRPAINETLSRTIMTSVTTMIAVLALLFFGGDDPARVLDGADDRHRGRHLFVDLHRECDGARPQALRDGPDAGAAREGRRRRDALTGRVSRPGRQSEESLP